MKKLICVEDVEQAQADGIALCVDGNTIVTPAAQDLIEAFQPIRETSSLCQKTVRLLGVHQTR